MVSTVLLPASAKQLVTGSQTKDLKSLYYQLHQESFSTRVKRKLGLLKVGKSLDRRFDLSPYSSASLNNVEAIWLSPEFGLSPQQLEILLDRMPSLHWVYWQRVGIENMHCELFKARGIVLSNSGDLVSQSVAEMNLACIIAQAKKLPDHIQLQRRHRWKSLYGEDLGSQTVGIIGTGNIASQTAKLCQALSMRVTAVSRSPTRFQGIKHPFDHIYHLYDELDVLLQEADYVVVAVPLNEETQNLIGMKQLKTMRSSATLINLARHKIVDEDALCNALSSNLIAAAYLDVLFNRRLYFWDRIYRTKNLYLTHNSSAHFRNKQQKALERFLYGLEHEARTGTFPDRVV